MMAMIMKENSQVLHRFIYQALIQVKWEVKECKSDCSFFMELLYQRLGTCAMMEDQAELIVEGIL